MTPYFHVPFFCSETTTMALCRQGLTALDPKFFFYFFYRKEHDAFHNSNDPLCSDFWEKSDSSIIRPNMMIKDWLTQLNDSRMPSQKYYLAVPLALSDVQTPFRLHSGLKPAPALRMSDLLDEYAGVCIVGSGMYIFVFCEDFVSYGTVVLFR